jgi:lysyl-tRNA synthetase, class II
VTEPTDQRAQRLLKLQALRAAGVDPYPARFPRTHTAAQALEVFASFEQAHPAHDADPAQASPPAVSTAGRLMAIRVMGKATFAHIMDGTGRLQIYLRQDELGDEQYQFFMRNMDLGDFVGVEGTLFRTRTGEVTVRVQSFAMLTKTLQLLPEKWHGLTDVEVRYRQRYLDLLANDKSRQTFVMRTRIVSAIRRFLDARGCLEVETPVLQPVYGGAAARPFVTHHNALDADLYLRISDELYLKRLVIGGLDRVYEIGRDFRNEGISTQHNPEFTQIEVYLAYADYNDMMQLVEECWATVAREVVGTTQITYQGQAIDLTPPWRRVTMRQAILDGTGVDIQACSTLPSLRQRATELGLKLDPKPTWGKQIDELFSEYVQPSFMQPTFMLDYPIDISPLAKKKPDVPGIVERFEFFVGGMECGNAFSELNDPIDQRERFEMQDAQLHQGDDEAHPVDEDWIRALEHGMPPTGGLGFGIDRMTMLLTDSASIRDVILFPTLRSKASGQDSVR